MNTSINNNYQTFKGGKSVIRKLAQQIEHNMSVSIASAKKGTVTNINGCNVQNHNGTDYCQFKTFPKGTRVLTNTFNQKRVTTLNGNEVVINEGGRIRVLSDDTFINSYKPVDKIRPCSVEYGNCPETKSGTFSYYDILGRVRTRERKELSEQLEKKDIKLKSYEPASCMVSKDATCGKLTLDVNGKEIDIRHPLETDDIELLRMLKGLFCEGKKPKDYNWGGISGDHREKFANDLLNKISQN